MEKINFVNGQAPALNATNLNQMQTNIEQAIAVGGVAGDTLPIGSVVEFASDVNVPANWLLCNGQAVSRTEYDLLFAIIGTTWGEGDGSTTFNVPTKEGLVTVGKKSSDTDFNTIGKTGGEKTHTLTEAELTEHYHSLEVATSSSSSETGYFQLLKEEGWSTNPTHTINGAKTTSVGGNQPHNNLQPYVTSNFIIKAKQSAGVVATVVDNLNSTSSTDALSARQGKILNEKNIITYGRNTDLTNFAADTWYPIYMNNVVAQVGDKLIPSNGTIKIGPGVSFIKINAAIWTAGRGYRWARIKKNDQIVAMAINELSATSNTNIWKTVVIESFLCEVEENDVITIEMASNESDMIVQAGIYSNSTYLTVETVR